MGLALEGHIYGATINSDLCCSPVSSIVAAKNKEMNIATSHPETVQVLNERLFEKDFSQSVELLEPFPERWSDHLIELVGDYVF